MAEYKCGHCGNSVSRWPSMVRYSGAVYCSRACSNRANARSGTANNKWKGGSYLQAGYRYVRVGPGSYVQEHRQVMEQTLGRPLTDDERVHHKNGDKLDNRPENLELMASQSAHQSHHMTQKPTRGFFVWDWESRGGGCADCGETSRPHYAKGLCTRCYQRTRPKAA